MDLVVSICWLACGVTYRLYVYTPDGDELVDEHEYDEFGAN